MMDKLPRSRSFAILFFGLTFLSSVLGVANEPPAVLIEGVEEGGVYFEPVSPRVQLAPGFRIENQTLNGEPYDGQLIEEQGLFVFEVTVVGQEADRRAEDSQPAYEPETAAISEELRFLVLDPQRRAPVYTLEIVDYHVQQLGLSPHVQPTASADSRLVLGRSLGWPEDPEILSHELYGFQVATPQADECKLRVVLVGGNHPREQTGSWALHGALDFLVGDDPRAAELRQWATFYVYPMVNPDGRAIVSGRSNPEMLAENVSDHNRVWNTSGRFSTIDVFVPALQADTGGTADYLLDFHSAGDTFFFTGPELMQSPYSLAMTAREPEILPRRSGGHPGMIRIWSMTEAGLNVRFGYTPELGGSVSAPRSLEIGRSYMLAFHDLISGSAALAAAGEVWEEASEVAWAVGVLEQLPALQTQLEQRLAAEDASVHATLEAAYALYDGIAEYRQLVQLADDASSLVARARQRHEQTRLTVASPLVQALAEQTRGLETGLQQPEAEVVQLREQIETVEGLLERVREAEQAETVLAIVAEALEPALEGFGAVFQNGLRARQEALTELLSDPTGERDGLRQARSAVEEALAELWQLGSDGPFTPVQPQPIEALPATVELQSADDWQAGLLVNLSIEQDALVPAPQAVLRFDGAGAHVVTDFHPGETTLGQQFTWEFWKQYTVFADNSGSSGNAGDEPRFYSQLSNTEGDLRAAVGDSYWTATRLDQPNRWYHVALVFDQGEVRTYVDGDLRDTRADVVFRGDSPSPFTIGRGFRKERWLDGATREHRIWNTARSQSQLRRDRHRSLDGSQPGLVALWPLDEGQGETVHDRSPDPARFGGTIVAAQWQPRGLPGFRLSQPLTLPGETPLRELTVDWQTAAEYDPAAAVVGVSVGFSCDPDTLPPQWHPLERREPMSLAEADCPPPGSQLWLRQTLSPTATDEPLRLQRLTLTLGSLPAEEESDQGPAK